MAVTNLGTGGAALDAQSGSTSGADTNDPKFLAHDGTNYVYLPGGSNSVGCTAPASAASYAAYPLGGGAPTTGAATGGAAFSFSTSGSWERVDLLNGSAAVVASFVAPSSGASTGGTDAYGVTWTINRATSGRKAVAVTAPVWLLGTDDYFEVADNALLDFGASDSFTALAVIRRPSFSGAYGSLFSKNNVDSETTAGWGFRRSGDSTGSAFGSLADGADLAQSSAITSVAGVAEVVGVVVDRSSQIVWGVQNGRTTSNSITAVGDMSNANPFRIGRPGAGTAYYFDTELAAVAVWRRALTADEIALVTAYYQSRWP